jgi:hypothetical protein
MLASETPWLATTSKPKVIIGLKKKKKKKLPACRGEGSAVGPLLAVLRCRCAALLVLVLMSTLSF